MDEEELAWDVVRDRINIEVESGEFAPFDKEFDKSLEYPQKSSNDRMFTLDMDEQQAGTSVQKQRKIGRRSANPTLDNLLGQANLEHARGRTKEAMTLLFEAVKLSPYHVQTYKELADLYAELGQNEKSFEFKMLASLINNKTTSLEWDELAEIAKSFSRFELSVACLAKAIRCDSDNWIYYEKRIQILDSLGDIDLAMKTRLQAAQSINCQTSQINFAWIDKLIKTAADYYCSLKDEERATEALEIFIFRSREFGRPIEFEHQALLGMWMGKGRFEDCAKSILALHHDLVHPVNEDGTIALEIEFTKTTYQITPFPPEFGVHWMVDNRLSTILLSYLIICLIQLGRTDLITELVDYLLERSVSTDVESAFLDIARSLHLTQKFTLAVEYMQKLKTARPEFDESADAWFLYGCLLQSIDQNDIARKAYETVISIQPGHIDARINLSTILQQSDQSELALETLKDVNLDSCSHIPNERLLIRQAEVLLEHRKMDQYISCLRLLLIPYFYQLHNSEEAFPLMRRRDKVLHSTLRRCAFDAIKGSSLERMVKRLGYNASAAHRPLEDLNANELHDYALKLFEALTLAGEYEDSLYVVCYAFLHPKIAKLGSQTFNNLLFFASIKAKHHNLAFEFLRFHMTYALPKLTKEKETIGNEQKHTLNKWVMDRLYSAMNFIFCQHQSVNYHRFIMRQLVKQPQCDTLHIISGNNSLITGAYRHALGEYFTIYLRDQQNPLTSFLIALTFTHISCKKDISSRHMVAMRAIAFMRKYGDLRSSSLTQEVQYNMGRMFHQMGLFGNALKCYERVLYECSVPMIWIEDPKTGVLSTEFADRYDLRRQAAYNMALIFDSSGNRLMARNILEQFCSI